MHAYIYIYIYVHSNLNRRKLVLYFEINLLNNELNKCIRLFCITFQLFVDRNFQANDLFHSNIKLTDDKNIVYSYKAMFILVISRFSDTASVVKQESGGYVHYNDHKFLKPIPLSNSKMADLLDTSGTILLFFHQVYYWFRLFYMNQSINLLSR